MTEAHTCREVEAEKRKTRKNIKMKEEKKKKKKKLFPFQSNKEIELAMLALCGPSTALSLPLPLSLSPLLASHSVSGKVIFLSQRPQTWLCTRVIEDMFHFPNSKERRARGGEVERGGGGGE